MKIYLAGKFNDKSKLATYRDELLSLGHTITFDWISFEQNKHRPPNQLCINSSLDINGVVNAHVVIVVMDDPIYAYRGTFTELGAAFALNKHVIIMTPNVKKLVQEPNKEHKLVFACQTNVFYFYGLNKEYIHYVDAWKEVTEVLAQIQHFDHSE